MQVTLLHYTPLAVAAKAIRTCWDSGDKSDTDLSLLRADSSVAPVCGENDKALIERVGNKFKHSSTLEHISFNLYIEGVSRALLQELSRHRIASISVKSSRYTLKELLNEEVIYDHKEVTYDQQGEARTFYTARAEKYLVFTGNTEVDTASMQALENLRQVLLKGVSNDKAKYCMPEAYKTTISWTVNARSLQNFLSLRSSKAALWEIRALANNIYEALPEEHKYLFTHCLGDSSEH